MEFQQQEQQVQTDLQPILENLINKNKSLTETGQQQEVISQEQEAQHILPEHLSHKINEETSQTEEISDSKSVTAGKEKSNLLEGFHADNMSSTLIRTNQNDLAQTLNVQIAQQQLLQKQQSQALSGLVDSSNKISPSLSSSSSSSTSASVAKKDLHNNIAANIDSASIITMNDLGKFTTEVTGAADSISKPSLNLNEVIQQQLSPFFENVNLNANNLNALQQQIAVAAATVAVQAANAQQGINNQTAAALLQKTPPVGLNSLLAAQLSAAVAAATAAVVNPTNVTSSLSPVSTSATSPDSKAVINNNLSPTLSHTSSGNANLQQKQQLLSPSNWNNQASWQQQQQQQQQQVSPNSLANTNLMNKNENLDEGSAATAALASAIQQQKALNLNKIANTNTLNAVNNLLTQQQQASKLQVPSKATAVNNLLNPLLQQVSSGSNTIQQALNSLYSSQSNLSTSNTSAPTNSNSSLLTNPLNANSLINATNTNPNMPNNNAINTTKSQQQSAKPTPALSAATNGNFSRLAANNTYGSGADQNPQYEMPLLDEQVQDRNNNSVLNTLINTSNLIANNANSSNNLNSFDMSVLNTQLLDLIRQDPFQIEQILKLKHLYQLGDQSNLIDEIHQLDQTVPANLAAAVGLTNMSLGLSLDQMNNPRNSSSRASLNLNQNFNAHHHLQANTSSLNNHNMHANGVNGTNYARQSNQQMNFPQNQQYNPNFLQLSLQQQQHLNTMHDYQEERFSRKVFVGGLPPDIDEDEIVTHFRQYGNLIVDWPHKAESKSYFPPKGYAFLIFQEERSVQELIETCVMDDNKLYMVVSSPSMKDKPVQIRPWCLADSDFVMDGSQPLDPRKTIFVGGVPRPLKAIELALIMNRFYGGVCYAGIDTDPELKYPKGAGRVAFSNQQSYIAAISARFVQLQHGEIDKRVEVKPYVLDDQMCDECQGARCGGKFAPFFCANVTCLQYYCEVCWATIHTRPGREYHKPLVKEGADRPRPLPYK